MNSLIKKLNMLIFAHHDVSFEFFMKIWKNLGKAKIQ